MRQGFIKVCAATPEIRVADCGYNETQITAAISDAHAQSVKLLVFPELCLTGCTCGDLFLQGTLLAAAEATLGKLLAHSWQMDMLVAVGLPVLQNGALYNCAAIMHKGVLLGVVPKTCLFNLNGCEESRWFSTPAAPRKSEVQLCGQTAPFGTAQLFYCANMPGVVIGVEIGSDLQGIEPPSNRHAAAGCTVLLNLSADRETAGRAVRRRMLIRAQSARLHCAYLSAEAGAGESSTDFVFGGHSMIAEDGEIIAENQPFSKATSICTELDCGKLAFLRLAQASAAQNDARSDYSRHAFALELNDTALSRHISKLPFVPEGIKEQDAYLETALQIQAAGLAARMRGAGIQAAVIGVSGGLDSTVALLVAERAMRELGHAQGDILAITMPCFGTTSRTRNNAQRLCDCLAIPCKTVDITDSVRQHFKDIGQSEETRDAAYENAQARERTQVLMDIANQTKGLVVGTGDLSELALGWATYNGDHMSMYAVNASVPKTMLRAMVRHIADTAPDKALRAVLQDILATPVSPELLPGLEENIAQETEAIVGPYELHDFFLYRLFCCGDGPEKILRVAAHAFHGCYDEATISHWLHVFVKRFFSQQFKRSCMPDGPQVSLVSLSPRGGWRMPSDASAALWLRSE